MKLSPPVNAEYAATVVTVRSIITLSNCDNVVGVPFFGYQAITGKDVSIGELYLLFGPETQLSEEYARLNNLHRHSDRNADDSISGYLEDNRRIRAMKFRGHRSSALLMPLTSLSYLGFSTADFKDGDVFDQLDGHEICRKYFVRTPGMSVKQTPKATRVEEKFFPKHFDTSNYFRNAHLLDDGDIVTVTQKLHGTSVRVGRVLVKTKLSWKARVAKRLGVKISENHYDYVYGSRNVTKDPSDSDQNHFYGSDIYTREGKKLEGLLPAGYVVYGELVGWAEGKTPIQKGYTYGVPEGEAHLFVYRVTHLNPEGLAVDLSWDQVKEFCLNVGLKHVPELGRVEHFLFHPEDYLDTRFADNEYLPTALPLSDPNSVDEGVCIRREGLVPLVLKAKSPKFLEYETKQLDSEAVDIEAEA